ncbi:MAG: hypothetical protein P4M11_15845 [Candidatus Pacebacteria bacterium]|nr:hypothetical protein [Candidatus Paceibacterota bacterium]
MPEVNEEEARSQPQSSASQQFAGYASPPVYPPTQYPAAGYGYFPQMTYVPYASCVYYPQMSAVPYYEARPQREDELDRLLGNVDKALSDQSSCRVIQRRLEEGEPEKRHAIVERLFDKMINKMEEYMNLPFGNYLCQKLFELLDEKQLYSIMVRVSPKIVLIANNIHGTRSVQKLLEASSKFAALRPEIVCLLETHVVELIMVFPFESEKPEIEHQREPCGPAVSRAAPRTTQRIRVPGGHPELSPCGLAQARLLRHAEVS